MILEPFYISRKNTKCPISLGVNISAFDSDSEVGMKVFNERVVSVGWKKSESEIIFYPPLGVSSISAYPTPDMEKMIVVKLGGGAGIPDNAVILNDKGEVIFEPKLPDRLSRKDKWLPRGNLYCFMQSGWCGYEDHIFFFLSIADTDWVETRYFNYKTMTWDEERYETWRL